MASKFFSSTEQAFSIGFGSSMTIVTTTYRYKPAPDAPSPAKPTPAAAKPAIATSISRKRARLQRTEQATEPDDDPPRRGCAHGSSARNGATGQRADASDGSREGKRDATTAATGTATDQRDGLSARNPRSVPRS
jgi:hypothetical protein